MTAAPSSSLDLDKLSAKHAELLAMIEDPSNDEPWSAHEYALDLLNAIPALIAAARESASLRVKLEAVKAERDAAEIDHDVWDKENTRLNSALAAATARERTLIGLVETAREALEPIAAVAKDIPATWAGGHQCMTSCSHIREVDRLHSELSETLTKLNEAMK